MVQQLILVVRGRLLTSTFGVFSVWMNIVRIVPARACRWTAGFRINKSSRVLEAVRVIDLEC